MSETTRRPAAATETYPGGTTFISALGEALGALITLALGIGLAFANQYVGADAQGNLGDMGLRIPALIASLLIVGQGIVMFIRLFSSDEEVIVYDAPEAEVITDPHRPGERGTGERTPSKAAAKEEDSSTTALALLGIGAWLGWSNLTFTPQEPLTFLCLIASFTLFSLGYGQLAKK